MEHTEELFLSNSNSPLIKELQKNQPTKKIIAKVVTLVFPDKIMNEPYNAKYAEKLVVRNNIRLNYISKPKENRSPKVASDTEKIANSIGIKNINWNEVRNHSWSF